MDISIGDFLILKPLRVEALSDGLPIVADHYMIPHEMIERVVKAPREIQIGDTMKTKQGYVRIKGKVAAIDHAHGEVCIRDHTGLRICSIPAMEFAD